MNLKKYVPPTLRLVRPWYRIVFIAAALLAIAIFVWLIWYQAKHGCRFNTDPDC